ncbi:glycosyltransferase family 4 protein [Butyrivibrio proteoclasticus]|uniref:glycosyltransferase family 4 protein n=1 Tax=Butyrivibrio proteoclasticus TaxID=43305 RepID=UPI00047D89DC|nr:glycosyltransferase family 4 protein [Butyrivibrio proteoclasticus]
MKVLWITNNEPTVVAEHFGRINYSGGWINYSHELLANDEKIELFVLSNGFSYSWTEINGIHYAGFQGRDNYPSIFSMALDEIKPDIVHVWGTEYEHFLETAKLMKARNMLDRFIVSIQGLVSIYDQYYCFALPERIQRRKTLYEKLRHTSIEDAHRALHKRGIREKEGIKISSNCIGRTDWDRAIIRQMNREITYYSCYEILRKAFYQTQWKYEDCEKHSIVFSQSRYILKGFHVLLDALVIVKQFYPDVKVYAVGKSPFEFANSIEKIKRYSFMDYIGEKIIDYDLTDNVIFVGSLNEKQMVDHYKRGNVFVCASGIENSSNSVGEAMILGMPVVASDVGGIKTFIEHNKNGILYQADSVNMLADGIMRVFEDTDKAIEMGRNAKITADRIYDPVANTKNMISIYEHLIMI